MATKNLSQEEAMRNGQPPGEARIDSGTEKWHFYTMAQQYDFVTWEEDGVWTCHAPAIPGAYGIGDTAAKARKDLVEALDLLFDYLASVGEAPPKSRKFRTGQVRV